MLAACSLFSSFSLGIPANGIHIYLQTIINVHLCVCVCVCVCACVERERENVRECVQMYGGVCMYACACSRVSVCVYVTVSDPF